MSLGTEARGFKPSDVEEPIDRCWHRPLADFLVVRPLRYTAVSPHQVTIASGAASLASGLCVAAAVNHRAWLALGGLLLLSSVVLDCADGQLARLRGQSTLFGRLLDGLVDTVAPTAVMTAMALLLVTSGYDPRWVWPLGALAGASLAWHASLYDAAKNGYLAMARPDFALGGDPLRDEVQIEALRRAHADRGQWLSWFVYLVGTVWARRQHTLLQAWRQPGRAPRDEAERARYVTSFRPVMRQARWLGFGTHSFVLTLAALGACWSLDSIVVAWLLIALPGNAGGLHIRRRWRLAERSYLEDRAPQSPAEASSNEPSRRSPSWS